MIRYNSRKDGELGYLFAKDHEGNPYKVEIRTGNCLAVLIQVTKKDGGFYHWLWQFFVDEKHIKNIRKDGTKIFYDTKVVRIRLNGYFKEAWTLAKYAVMDGYKVEMFYKEPKVK